MGSHTAVVMLTQVCFHLSLPHTWQVRKLGGLSHLTDWALRDLGCEEVPMQKLEGHHWLEQVTHLLGDIVGLGCDWPLWQ